MSCPTPARATGPITPRDSARAPELLPAQRPIWERAVLLKDYPAYTLTEGYRIKGPINIAALSGAFKKVLRRHEVLRTTIQQSDGAPVLSVAAPGLLQGMKYVSVSGDAGLWRAREIFNSLALTPVCLETAPLLQAVLIAVGAQDHVLIIVTHHLVFDGWSARVLLSEISYFYRAATTNDAPSAPDLPVQLGDVAIWSWARLDAGLRDRQLTYWRDQLAGPFQPARLSQGSCDASGADWTAQQGDFRVDVDVSTTAALMHLARAERSTAFMVIVAGFAAALAQETGASDICIATHAANRNRPEVQGLIGYFTNMVLLRLDVRPGDTFRDLIAKARNTVLDAMENADVPFEDVAAMLDQQAEAAGTRPDAFATAMLVMESGAAQMPEFPGTSVKPFPPQRSSDHRFRYSPVDVNLTLAPENGALSGACTYRSDRLEGHAAARLFARFTHILGDGARDPGRVLGETPAESGSGYDSVD